MTAFLFARKIFFARQHLLISNRMVSLSYREMCLLVVTRMMMTRMMQEKD